MAKQDVTLTQAFGRNVDFGRAASDYRQFRAGFPQRFFDELARRGLATAGRRALDLGTGTGTVARGLAQLGLAVTGVDPAAALLAEAASLDREAGVSVAYRVGRAETIEQPDHTFDLVTAGQCWHWFDRSKAAQEAARVLKPGGHLVIAHFDWLPLPENVVDATESLIVSFNSAWSMGGGTGVYPQWLTDLAVAGFEEIETFSFDLCQPYSHEAWRGRIRASAGVKASLDEQAVKRFDSALDALLQARFPEDPLLVPHRVWAAVGLRPSTGRRPREPLQGGRRSIETGT